MVLSTRGDPTLFRDKRVYEQLERVSRCFSGPPGIETKGHRRCATDFGHATFVWQQYGCLPSYLHALTCFIETYLALSRLSPTMITANPGTLLCFDLIRSTSRRTCARGIFPKHDNGRGTGRKPFVLKAKAA